MVRKVAKLLVYLFSKIVVDTVRVWIALSALVTDVYIYITHSHGRCFAWWLESVCLKLF